MKNIIHRTLRRITSTSARCPLVADGGMSTAFTRPMAVSTAAFHQYHQRRHKKTISNDPTYEDDRWLEVENDPEKTAEERYAQEQSHLALKKMMAQIRKETDAKVSQVKEEVAKEKEDEVEALKRQVSELASKLEELKK